MSVLAGVEGSDSAFVDGACCLSCVPINELVSLRKDNFNWITEADLRGAECDCLALAANDGYLKTGITQDDVFAANHILRTVISNAIKDAVTVLDNVACGVVTNDILSVLTVCSCLFEDEVVIALTAGEGGFLAVCCVEGVNGVFTSAADEGGDVTGGVADNEGRRHCRTVNLSGDLVIATVAIVISLVTDDNLGAVAFHKCQSIATIGTNEICIDGCFTLVIGAELVDVDALASFVIGKGDSAFRGDTVNDVFIRHGEGFGVAVVADAFKSGGAGEDELIVGGEAVNVVAVAHLDFEYIVAGATGDVSLTTLFNGVIACAENNRIRSAAIDVNVCAVGAVVSSAFLEVCLCSVVAVADEGDSVLAARFSADDNACCRAFNGGFLGNLSNGDISCLSAGEVDCAAAVVFSGNLNLVIEVVKAEVSLAYSTCAGDNSEFRSSLLDILEGDCLAVDVSCDVHHFNRSRLLSSAACNSACVNTRNIADIDAVLEEELVRAGGVVADIDNACAGAEDDNVCAVAGGDVKGSL